MNKLDQKLREGLLAAKCLRLSGIRVTAGLSDPHAGPVSADEESRITAELELLRAKVTAQGLDSKERFVLARQMADLKKKLVKPDPWTIHYVTPASR
jgi:hypothetical protein